MTIEKDIAEQRRVEFVRLFRALDWTQRRCAERLGIKESSMSMFLSGQACPRESTLRLMKTIVAGHSPEALRPVTEGEHHRLVALHEQAEVYGAKLVRLPPDKEAFVKNMIDFFSANPGAPVSPQIPGTPHTAEPGPAAPPRLHKTAGRKSPPGK